MLAKKFVFEQNDVGIVSFPILKVCMSCEDVRLLHLGPWFADKLKRELLKFRLPPCLPLVQFLGSSEVLQVFVVGPYLEDVLHSQQALSPVL